MSSLRTTEHRRRAVRAGLTYVTDAFAGITRKRAGTGWAYYAPNGARIRGRKQFLPLDSLRFVR